MNSLKRMEKTITESVVGRMILVKLIITTSITTRMSI
nr:MAG TPA: hypothetical protein [Bacteriophage sp.]